jgi:hypothetical protein
MKPTQHKHTGTVGLMVAQLRDRKRHLEEELALLSVALEALEKAWSIDVCIAKDDAIVNQLTADTHVRPSAELRGLSYADATERVLQRGERLPVGTRILIRKLEVAGKRVKGKDPYRILYRSLEKDSRFKRVEGKWALSEWYPPPVAPPLNEAEKAAKKHTTETAARKETVN